MDIPYPEPSEDRFEFLENNETQQRINNNVRIPRRGPEWFVSRRTPNTLGCVQRVAADQDLQRTLQQQQIASNYSADSEAQERNYQIDRHNFTYIRVKKQTNQIGPFVFWEKLADPNLIKADVLF